MRPGSAGDGGRIGGCSRRHQRRQVRLGARHCRPRLVRQKPLQPCALLGLFVPARQLKWQFNIHQGVRLPPQPHQAALAPAAATAAFRCHRRLPPRAQHLHSPLPRRRL